MSHVFSTTDFGARVYIYSNLTATATMTITVLMKCMMCQYTEQTIPVVARETFLDPNLTDGPARTHAFRL